MACSVCAANYGAWLTMSCGTRGIGAAGPHSPADVTVLSLLSWFPRRPAWAWPISQIAAGVQLRSDRLGNNVEEKQQKATAEQSRSVRSFDRPYDFWMPASCSRPSPLDNFSSGMSGDSVAGDRLRGSGSSESWPGEGKKSLQGNNKRGPLSSGRLLRLHRGEPDKHRRRNQELKISRCSSNTRGIHFKLTCRKILIVKY